MAFGLLLTAGIDSQPGVLVEENPRATRLQAFYQRTGDQSSRHRMPPAL